jgi:photosystem II stability/assembly factor-like uncharacterized protein
MKAHARQILPVVFALLAFSPAGLFAGVGEWTSSGPEGGYVVALASHPSNPSTVYVATARGLYKSVDAGGSWAPLALSGQFDVVVPTSDPATVYASMLGDFGVTFQRTTDGGASWVGRATPVGRLVSATVDPNDPMTVYAVTTSGLFRSTNGGDIWEALPNSPVGGASPAGIAVDPADSRVLYASLSGGNVSGVYRSSDRGATWNRTSLRDPAFTLLFDPVDASRLFALTIAGLQVTLDRGESWRRLARGHQPYRLAIDSADSNLLYIIAGGFAFRSSDGGETVTPIDANSVRGYVDTIVASASGVVLTGSGRGVYRSEDAGRAWKTANLGIRETFVPSLAVDPADPAVVFAASGQGIYSTRDRGQSWEGPVAGSPAATVVAIDPSNRSTLYASGRGVHKSTDGGQTWQDKTPLVDGRLADYIADLVIDPNDARRVLAAYDSVYRSLDGAESWTRVLTPADIYSSYYYPATVARMAISPSNGATVFAGGADGGGFLYRSDDGGDNWSDVTSVDFGVTALAVDSCDPRILHAGGHGVYRTLNGGSFWLPGQLPGSVFALARDPRHSSSVFAGTSSGLFWTNDSGASWKRFDPALTDAVHSVALDASGRFLYAGTERGVFSLERNVERCRTRPDRLCLIGARFELTVTARNPLTGAEIAGLAIEEGDRFGYFSFPGLTGDSDLPEVLVKMADKTGLPAPGGYVWVFHSALTDLDYTLTVHDTQTGRIRTYVAENGDSVSSSLTCGEADTSAFAPASACGGEVSSASLPGSRLAAASGGELSLRSGRFRATLRATDPRTGRIGDGAAIPREEGFGYFSLPGFTGDPSFPEVFVKMTDTAAQSDGYVSVFHTGLTDLDYTLTVTDAATGEVRTYTGGATDGTRLCGAADTAAFRN